MKVVRQTAAQPATREVVLVQVEDVHKHFPIGAGLFGG